MFIRLAFKSSANKESASQVFEEEILRYSATLSPEKEESDKDRKRKRKEQGLLSPKLQARWTQVAQCPW